MAIKPIEILIRAKDGASSVFGSLQAKVTAVAAAIAGYFGIGMFVNAVRGAADLEAGMSRIQAASGASAQEMAALKQAAEDAGASTKYTATEAASALENLIKSGLGAKDAIAALPAVLNLAQAGDVALAVASEYVTKAVKGMGLEFTDAARVADVLAMGANASSTSVTGLAEALSYAAPVARAAGLTLEQTVAIIGKFADSGIDASRAGTALNAILSQFIDPASKFRTELGAAGITTRDFDQALRQLAAAGPKGQQAILAVGTEAGPALRALLNQGIGALDELKGKLDSAKGSAAETAAIMERNLNGAFSGLGSAWDAVKIKLAEPVLPVLTDAIKQLIAGLNEGVSNGTVGRFGTAIATGFQSALTWARQFAAEVDFTATAAKLQNFATQTGEVFTRIGDYATNAGNLVRLVYGVMSSGVNAVLTAVYGLGAAYAAVASRIQSGLADLLAGISKITFGSVSASFKQAADEMRRSAEATGAASAALKKEAEEAFNGVADGAEMARDAYADLTSEASTSKTAHTASAAAIGSVASALQDLGEKAPGAAQKQIAAVTQTSEAVKQLRVDYEAAMAAGDTQLAAEKQQALRGELQKTGEEAKKLAEKLALDVNDAFTRMGIVSQEKLRAIAVTAQEDFETLKASGLATAMDLQNAFTVMAQKTLEASGSIGSVGRAAAQSTLEAKAAAAGLSLEFDAAGKVIVKSMSDATTAATGLGKAIRATTADLVAQAAEMARLADAAFKYSKVQSGFGNDQKPGGSAGTFTDSFGEERRRSDGAPTGTFTNTLQVDQAYAVTEKYKKGLLTLADMQDAEIAYMQAKAAMQYIEATRANSPGAVSYEASSSAAALLQSAKSALESLQAQAAALSTSQAPPLAPEPAAPPPAPAPAPTTYTTIVNIAGNKQERITVSDQASAAALLRVLNASKP